MSPCPWCHGPEDGAGCGHFHGPPWAAHDRDAQAIREILRRAGRRESTLGFPMGPVERHGGFVVEDGEEHATFLSVGAGLGDAEAAGELRHTAEALTAAGDRVTPDRDDQVLRVRR